MRILEQAVFGIILFLTSLSFNRKQQLHIAVTGIVNPPTYLYHTCVILVSYLYHTCIILVSYLYHTCISDENTMQIEQEKSMIVELRIRRMVGTGTD